jgi:hypothetical protein
VVDERVDCFMKLLLDPKAEVAVILKKFMEITREEPAVGDHDTLSTYVAAHSSDGPALEFSAVAPNPLIAWTIDMRLCEALVDFVHSEHPQWWPHTRLEM